MTIRQQLLAKSLKTNHWSVSSYILSLDCLLVPEIWSAYRSVFLDQFNLYFLLLLRLILCCPRQASSSEDLELLLTFLFLPYFLPPIVPPSLPPSFSPFQELSLEACATIPRKFSHFQIMN